MVALDMLIPKSLEESMTGRPELKTYSQRLQYVQAHVMHHRANVQSAALAKDSNAMQLGNLDRCPDGDDGGGVGGLPGLAAAAAG